MVTNVSADRFTNKSGTAMNTTVCTNTISYGTFFQNTSILLILLSLVHIVMITRDVLFGVFTIHTAVDLLGLRLDKPERQDRRHSHHH